MRAIGNHYAVKDGDTLFKGISISERGASHIERQTPCQDYSGHCCDEKFGIAVVSDGHGSKKHFRSDKGSEIAVNVSIEAVKEFIGREDEYIDSLFDDPDKYLMQLERNIVYRWNDAVSQHLRKNPYSEEEYLKHRDIPPEKAAVAYGATLLIGVMTEKYWFGIQTGDGSCVTIIRDDDAGIFVPDDDRLAFGFTTSLCDSDAAGNFRHYFGKVNEETLLPRGMIMSTDGVVDSFTEEYFLRFNLKTIKTLLSNDDDAEDDIRKSLIDLSEKGSRDDVSIAIVYSEEADSHLEESEITDDG